MIAMDDASAHMRRAFFFMGEQSTDMKKILMIATGGTIASKNTKAGLAPALSADDLLACVPEIKTICRVEEVQPFNLDSTNIYSRHWLEIEKIVETNYSEYDGFVVTHGTDTMAYTAAALSYLMQDIAKPVVLTGSQNSAYLRDTDARKNLLDAFCFASDDNAFGVNLVFNGAVILGTRSKKTRTRSYNAFSSIDYPDVALMREGKPLYFLNEPKPRTPRFYHRLNDKVFVLKMVPGISPDIFDYLKEHCDGLVIESFGSGGLPSYENDELFSRLKDFLSTGKAAVFTTQVEREGSALDKYEVGRKLLSAGSVLEAKSMTTEATVAKFMWALAEAKSGQELRKLFETPVRHDIY